MPSRERGLTSLQPLFKSVKSPDGWPRVDNGPSREMGGFTSSLRPKKPKTPVVPEVPDEYDDLSSDTTSSWDSVDEEVDHFHTLHLSHTHVSCKQVDGGEKSICVCNL